MKIVQQNDKVTLTMAEVQRILVDGIQALTGRKVVGVVGLWQRYQPIELPAEAAYEAEALLEPTDAS